IAVCLRTPPLSITHTYNVLGGTTMAGGAGTGGAPLTSLGTLGGVGTSGRRVRSTAGTWAVEGSGARVDGVQPATHMAMAVMQVVYRIIGMKRAKIAPEVCQCG